MPLRVFDFRNATTPQEFIDFWAVRYSYPNGNLYDRNIGHPLTMERVWELYEWKNGTSKIARKKRQSIENVYLPELNRLPLLTTPVDGRKYLGRLGGGAIWDIFWLHCLKPDLFPIFDQHTYRAMASLKEMSLTEIPAGRDRKIAIYFDKYLPFVRAFGVATGRSLDKALFAYGRFLKSSFAAPHAAIRQ